MMPGRGGGVKIMTVRFGERATTESPPGPLS
ncbi:MAG: hypothetical protein AVDCRST_MAG73-3558, partial [uncultured Thermomicrobiales bacterium]